MTADKTAEDLRTEFLKTPALCAAVVVAIHVLPKNPAHGLPRLVMTLAYFGALLIGVWSATQPLDAYLKRLYAKRYEDAGPVIEKSWQMYLHSLQAVVTPLAYLVIAFVAATGLSVLVAWPVFAPLAGLAPVWNLAWCVAGLGLLLYPFVRGGEISALQQRRRMLQEQLEIADFEPKQDVAQTPAEAAKAALPVEAIDDHKFRAGGFVWEWEDLYKNAVVFGQPGTGKTVCVLNAVLEGLLASTARSSEKPSALILDPKGDYYGKIRAVCRRYGREQDLLVLDPADVKRTIRYNPLDSTDDELEVASRFAATMEALGMKSDDSFWIDSAKKFVRHAVALTRITNPAGRPPDLADILELSGSFARISERVDRIADDDARGDNALAFFEEWMGLADNTRSSVQAYVSNMIDPFLLEPYRTVFSGRSTMRIGDMIDAGKILYVHMPIADKEAMSRVICTLVKLEYFREVLKRPNKTRSSFFLCDEFQSFLTIAQGKGDADFFERSRQSRHANVVATQNLPALTKRANEKETIHNLLGNCAVKLFLRNSDNDTNTYASELFGQQLVQFWGGSSSAGQGGRLSRALQSTSSQSSSLQYDASVRKEAFARLAIPSRADGIDYAETIVHLGSRGKVTREKLRWQVHPLSE